MFSFILASTFFTWITANQNISKADAIDCDCYLNSNFVSDIAYIEIENGEKEVDVFLNDRIYSFIGYGSNVFRINNISVIDVKTNNIVTSTATGFCSILENMKCIVDNKYDLHGDISKRYKIKG